MVSTLLVPLDPENVQRGLVVNIIEVFKLSKKSDWVLVEHEKFTPAVVELHHVNPVRRVLHIWNNFIERNELHAILLRQSDTSKHTAQTTDGQKILSLPKLMRFCHRQ